MHTILIKAAGAAFLSGALCSCGNNVYFGTSTRLAIDFSSDGAGIGYKNYQIAHVPPKKDGTGFSVLGTSDVDISIDEIVIDEEFATGVAADCVSNRAAVGGRTTATPNYGPLLFGSYTSISFVDLNLGATNPFIGATFGYKRSTATVVPIVEDNLRTVYVNSSANSMSTTELNNPPGSRTGGIRFVQEFATGTAAINRAKANVVSLTGSNSATTCP